MVYNVVNRAAWQYYRGMLLWDPYPWGVMNLTHWRMNLDVGLLYVHHITRENPVRLLQLESMVLWGAPNPIQYLFKTVHIMNYYI